MTKRKRKLQPVDFEKRALARYANECFLVGESLSTSFDILHNGDYAAVVRDYGSAVAVYQVVGNRIKKIDLPIEFW